MREMDRVLKARKGLWKCTRSTMVGSYLQHCILPRVTYSPADAAFCAVFMRRLIELAVPWFHAFLYLDAVSAMCSQDCMHSDALQMRCMGAPFSFLLLTLSSCGLRVLRSASSAFATPSLLLERLFSLTGLASSIHLYHTFCALAEALL